MQMQSEVVKQVRRREGKVTVKPDTTRLYKHQEDQKGIIGERGGGTVILLGKRAIRRRERRWMLTMNSDGIEISIARGVDEIVRDPTPSPSFFFFVLYHVFIVTVQELACSASYALNKASISKHGNKRKTTFEHLTECQVLDTSPNIWLIKESKIMVTAKKLLC